MQKKNLVQQHDKQDYCRQMHLKAVEHFSHPVTQKAILKRRCGYAPGSPS